jgi:hypothetical protein
MGLGDFENLGRAIDTGLECRSWLMAFLQERHGPMADHDLGLIDMGYRSTAAVAWMTHLENIVFVADAVVLLAK